MSCRRDLASVAPPEQEAPLPLSRQTDPTMCSPPPCEVESPGEVIDWYAEEESPEGEWDEELMKWENKKNLPMHPVLPESWSDLRPLPPVAGPKLKPFDFGDDDSIEFLEVLADTKKCGTSIVMKVRIEGSIYALKLVSWPLPTPGLRHSSPSV